MWHGFSLSWRNRPRNLLYDIDLAVLRILVRTVCKFSRKRHAVQCGFSSCKVTGLSGCFSGSLCKNRFLNSSLGNCRILLQENLQLLAYNAVYRTSCLAVSKFLLGLSSNCGFSILTLTIAVRPSRISSPLKFGSLSLRSLFLRA